MALGPVASIVDRLRFRWILTLRHAGVSGGRELLFESMVESNECSVLSNRLPTKSHESMMFV